MASLSTPDERLDLAVDRGIISAEQAAAIRALDVGAGAPGPRREAERGINGVTIAYYAGAAAILFAFGWFLVDRWKVLGPGGVLVVSLVYAALFLVVAWWLGREGYHEARGLATLAAVGMTPTATWAVLSLAGVWTPPLGREPPPIGWDRDWQSLRWIPIELATALAALVALRRVRFALLVLPVAAAVWAVASQVVQVAFDQPVQAPMQGWTALVVSSLLLLAGYAVDRRTADEEEDFAWPLYAVAVVALMFAHLEVWSTLKAGRHALPFLALLLAAAALYLRRRIFLVAATVAFITYVGWLGFEVFRKALGFPIALATVGLVIILGAVWVQRRFPGLRERATRRVGEAPELPGGWLAPVGAVVLAVALFLTGPERARERARDQAIRQHALMMRRANERRAAERAKRDSVVADSLRRSTGAGSNAPARRDGKLLKKGTG